MRKLLAATSSYSSVSLFAYHYVKLKHSTVLLVDNEHLSLVQNEAMTSAEY